MSLIPFTPLESNQHPPPNEEMVKTIESAGADLSINNLEIITALIVQELERRDEDEESLRAIGLHGMFGQGGKRK